MTAFCNFKPLIAAAVSCVFLKETRKYEPRDLADFALLIGLAPYRTYMRSLLSVVTST